MTRDLTPEVVAASEAVDIEALLLITMYFDSGAVRLWTGYGQLDYNGNLYVGTGDILKVSGMEESAEIRATGISLEMAGLDPAIIQIALAEPYQGRQIDVLFAMMDDNHAIIPDPKVSFRGRMDIMTIDDQAETVTITLSAESRLIDFDTAPNRMYTAEDQAIDFPGDKGLDFVPDIQEMDFTWGRQ